MTKVKWLWSISIAMGIVLLYASLSAYFIKIDGWYESLILPHFALPPRIMAIGWSLAYIVNIAIIARLIYHREHAVIILPLVILGVLNILWCLIFFRFHSPLASLVILAIACALIFAIFVMAIRRDYISMVIIEPIFAWYVYLTVVNYYILIGNLNVGAKTKKTEPTLTRRLVFILCSSVTIKCYSLFAAAAKRYDNGDNTAAITATLVCAA